MAGPHQRNDTSETNQIEEGAIFRGHTDNRSCLDLTLFSDLVAIKSTQRSLLPDLRQLILTAREQVARAIDGRLAQLYWEIGRRIRQDILEMQRATYGEKIVATLLQKLENEFGRGFSDKSLRHMIRFAEVFTDQKIVSALSRQLAWNHCKEIFSVRHSPP